MRTLSTRAIADKQSFKYEIDKGRFEWSKSERWPTWNILKERFRRTRRSLHGKNSTRCFEKTHFHAEIKNKTDGDPTFCSQEFKLLRPSFLPITKKQKKAKRSMKHYTHSIQLRSLKIHCYFKHACICTIKHEVIQKLN